MDYIELTLDAADAEQAEILTAELADIPFESFEQEMCIRDRQPRKASAATPTQGNATSDAVRPRTERAARDKIPIRSSSPEIDSGHRRTAAEEKMCIRDRFAAHLHQRRPRRRFQPRPHLPYRVARRRARLARNAPEQRLALTSAGRNEAGAEIRSPPPLFYGRNSGPVSYTHLDVYKRQEPYPRKGRRYAASVRNDDG